MVRKIALFCVVALMSSMAFATIFGSVAPKVATAVGIAGGIITVFDPPLGALVNKLGAIITGVEGLYTTEKAGVAKKATVSQIALSEIPQLEEIVAQFGVNAKVPEAELGHAIDAFVAAYNSAGAFLKAIQAANAKPGA